MDIAVKHPSEDRLGRRRFANSLASQIWHMNTPSEGYVFGLEGEWGAGKSSVINLVLYRLLHLELGEYSGHANFHRDREGPYSQELLDELAGHFDRITKFSINPNYLNYVHPDHYHRQIATAAAGNERLETQIYRYFRLRLRATEDPKCLVVHFRPWLIPDTAALSTVFISELVKSIGSKFGLELESAFEDYSAMIKSFAPAAGAAAQVVVPGAGNIVRELLSAFGSKKDRTLEDRKKALEAALGRLKGRKIVVVIDDLDRLSPKEATEMVGLVKSLGSLPNVIYLISYEPQILAKHIFRTLRVDGDSYLEKIIQYRRRLPLLAGDALTSLLVSYINPLIDDATTEVLDRLKEALFIVGRQYVTTPRDAKRCGDWFQRSYHSLQNQTDIVDLLIIEIVQAKDVHLYSWIRSNLDLLCTDYQQSNGQLKKSLESQGIPVTEVRIRTLSALFPAAASEFKRIQPNAVNVRINKRIQIRDFADGYFDIAETDMNLRKDRIQRVLRSISPEQELHEFLDETENLPNSNALRAAMLDALWEFFTTNPLDPIWADALFSLSEKLIRLNDRLSDDPFEADNMYRLTAIIINGLAQVSPSSRLPILMSGLEHDDLSLICAVMRRVRSSFSSDESGFTMLQLRASSAIEAHAKEDRILTAADPSSILYLWSEIGLQRDLEAHINAALLNRQHFAAIANAILSVSVSSHRGVYYRLSEWGADWLDMKQLETWALDLQTGDDDDDVRWAGRIISAIRENRKHDE